MSSTFKPKLTMTNKGRMKHYKDVLNLETKKHDHGESFFFYFLNLRCKWHEYMQGAKYIVDLI
jgi:hypothetical protein